MYIKSNEFNYFFCVWDCFFALRSVMQQLVVSITLPNLGEAGWFLLISHDNKGVELFLRNSCRSVQPGLPPYGELIMMDILFTFKSVSFLQIVTSSLEEFSRLRFVCIRKNRMPGLPLPLLKTLLFI